VLLQRLIRLDTKLKKWNHNKWNVNFPVAYNSQKAKVAAGNSNSDLSFKYIQWTCNANIWQNFNKINLIQNKY